MQRRLKGLVLALTGLTFSLLLVGRLLPNDAAMAIRGGRVYTITRGILDNGVIIIRNGKIQDVGKDLAIPPGARIIEAASSFIFPGFIDAGTNLGTVELETVEKDDDEAASPLTPQLKTLDSFNPESRLIPKALELGITSVLVAPARGNLLSGQSALIRLGGSDVSDMVIKPVAAVHGSLGDVLKPRSKQNPAYPYTRMGGAALLRQTLADARYYLDRALEFEKKPRESQADAKARQQPPIQPPLQALIPVVRGEVPLVITANRLDDILTALRIARESGVRIIINEGAHAWRIKDRLAAQKVPVILRPRVDFGTTVETEGARHENAALLEGAGVKIAFQSGSIQNFGDLLSQVRLAVEYGLAPDDALRALTINAAEIFGVADQVGSLEKGKSADLVIFSGNPLLSAAKVKAVIVKGQVVGEREK